MDVFYCLIHTPEAITPELCVLSGATEIEAVHGVNEVARDWPRLGAHRPLSRQSRDPQLRAQRPRPY